MVKKGYLVVIAILFIGASIIINGYFIGNAIKSADLKSSNITSVDSNVLNLPEVADYLKITEEEVRGIIKIEKNQIEKTGSFSGKMFPYYMINNEKYFYKDEIDEWLKEVSSSYGREYNTIE